MTSTHHPKTAQQTAGITRTVSAGLAHHQAGRLQRAEVLYRKALEKDPDHADALHLLGVVAYQCGQFGAAIGLIERALPALQELPDAHLNLGNALRSTGRLAEAAESYRRAIALQPDNGMAHSNLARALIDQGLFESGLESAQRATAYLPEFPGAHANLAAALMGLERCAEAEAPLRKAIAAQPDNWELLRGLAEVLIELEQFEEAVAACQRAIDLDSSQALSHHSLASALLRNKDLVGSEASARRALELDSRLTGAWNRLGGVLRIGGRFEEAEACFRRALEIDPDQPEAHRALAHIGQLASDEAQIDRLRTVLHGSDQSVSRRASAGFAAGTLLDHANRYDEAFPCFAEANRLLHGQADEAGNGFDVGELRRAVDQSMGQFDGAQLSSLAGWGNPSDVPVFIVGMPRSGTSLVEQIAASHSRVVGAGEFQDVGRIGHELLKHNGGKPLAQWDAGLARELADRHVARLRDLGPGAARVIDKMPDNLFYLGFVSALFPATRVILCQRDPRDTCLSCYFHWFTQPMPWTYDLEHCGLRALEADRMATHWLRELPLEIMVIDYEELVADLEGESRRLIEFLGLDWEPACLDFHRTERPIFTASSWQVRQPLFTHSVGRWRRYESHLGPLLDVLRQGGVIPASGLISAGGAG